MSLDGNVLGVIGRSGRLLGQFSGAHGLACPSETEIYVAETSNWRVQKLRLRPPAVTVNEYGESRESMTEPATSSLQRRFDCGAQLGRDLRIDAEPRLPRRAHLVQQHAQAIDRGVAAAPRGCEQRRLQRHVDDVARRARSQGARRA